MTPAVERYTSYPLPSTKNRQIQRDDTEVVPAQNVQACLTLLPTATSLTTDNWASSPHYLYGIDLFNGGYWWEAHAAWELLWHKSGHQTEIGLFLLSLIQSAGALYQYNRDSKKAALALWAKAKRCLAKYPDLYVGTNVRDFSRELDLFLMETRRIEPVIRLT